MARLAAVFFWVLGVATAVAFIVHPIWLPEVVSAHGVDVDREIDLTFVVAGAAFVLAHILLGIFLWRFGGKSTGPALYWHENRRMEITWTVVTAVIFVGLGLQGEPNPRAEPCLTDPPANALAIEVTGEQFAWNIRYPGPDGKFGRTRPDKVDGTGATIPILDDSDPPALTTLRPKTSSRFP